MTGGRQGGQGKIDDNYRCKGLRTAVALSTASCSLSTCTNVSHSLKFFFGGERALGLCRGGVFGRGPPSPWFRPLNAYSHVAMIRDQNQNKTHQRVEQSTSWQGSRSMTQESGNVSKAIKIVWPEAMTLSGLQCGWVGPFCAYVYTRAAKS